ncbi:MAG: hypothetical protein HQL80_06120 [Magnetococcales bacterium]|nr:hypothetical protein [Magnetococcales bacterium]
MAITQSFAVELLAGETLKVAGPGLVEFSAPEIVPAKMGAVMGAKGGAAGAAATQMQVGAGTGQAVISTATDPNMVVTATGSKAAAGTIWNGKGLSLGLGRGLGAWGPVLLATAITVGGYVYWKKKQSAKVWPF